MLNLFNWGNEFLIISLQIAFNWSLSSEWKDLMIKNATICLKFIFLKSGAKVLSYDVKLK